MSASASLTLGVARLPGKPVAALPTRTKPAVLPIVPRPAFRVLQTGRAPAQLSLFLRPGIGNR
jgi:hypothetical protein